MKHILNPLFSDSVIEEMASGDISPQASGILENPFLKLKQNEAEELAAKLLATLTDEQKALFQQYAEVLACIKRTREKLIFAYAFKLGARVMDEISEDVVF